jgi:hypothetical protein
MRQLSILRSFVGFALLATLAIGISGCGGGGSGNPDSSTDNDLALVTFLITEERADGSLVQIGGPNSTNILRDARLLFTFTTSVDLASVNDRSLKVGIPTGSGLTEKAVGIYYHPVNSFTGEQIRNQVVFNPTFSVAGSYADNPEGFKRLTSYDIEIPSVETSNVYLRNLKGDGAVTAYLTKFETGSDYSDTGVQPIWNENLSAPQDGVTGVDAKADIVVAFDQPMKRDSVILGDTFRVQNTFDGTAPLGTLRYSPDLTRIIFRPVFGYGKGIDSTQGGMYPVNPDTDGYPISVVVTRDVTNLSGNPTPREITFSFRTKYDPTQPDFDDIRETFESTAMLDTTFSPPSANALWDSPAAAGYLAGTFTQGTVTISNHNNVVTLEPFAVGNVAAQFQALYYSTEVGGSFRTITGFDWHKYATGSSTTCQNVQILMGVTTSGSLTANFSANYSGTPTTCVNGVTYQIPVGSYTFQSSPAFTSNFAYNGSDNLILEIVHTGSSGGGYVGTTPLRGFAEWLENNGGSTNRAAQTVAQNAPYVGPRVAPFAYDIRFHYLIDESEARSQWYDSGLISPQYLDIVLIPSLSTQPTGTSSEFVFQGAPEAVGSAGQVDTSNTTDWEPGLPELSGYRFVRFQVKFKGNGQTAQQPAVDELIIPFIFFSVD